MHRYSTFQLVFLFLGALLLLFILAPLLGMFFATQSTELVDTWREAEVRESIWLTSVSYTHLDVYKRQIPDSPN